MNGMATDSVSYVIAAYAVTWVVLVSYTIRLISLKRRIDASHISER